MLVIPAVDIRGGRCVRLQQGRPDLETVFAEDPVQAAQGWADQGAELVHVVDLDGAFEGEPVNAGLIEDIGRALPDRVQVGGGIRSADTIRRYLREGIRRVVIGTRAFEDPAWLAGICAEFPGRICAGIDSRDGLVAVKGWKETTPLRALDALRSVESAGVAAVIYTDIKRDGMLSGPNLESIREVVAAARVPIIASGGVSGVADVRALRKTSVAGVIIGKALYTGELTYLQARATAGDEDRQ